MPRNSLVIDLPPLPETNAGFTSTVALNLNNEVHMMLRNGLYEKVRPYIEAAQNAKAVTGSVAFDRGEAARITKQHAIEVNNTFVASKKPIELDKALNVAMKREGISRKQRLMQALAAPLAAE